jgi:hypothetical protein
MANRYKSAVFAVKSSEFVCVEVDRDDKLPPIIEEMMRWRDIMGSDYNKYKQSKIRGSLV